MKKVVTLCVFSLLFLIFASPIFADGATNPSLGEIQDCLKQYNDEGKVSQCILNYYGNATKTGYWIWQIGDCRLAPLDNGQTPEECQKLTGVGQVTNGIAYLYTSKPVKTTDFIAYYRNKINPVKDAYAQGIGFAGLSPLLGLWRGMRNIAYAFIILIMVVIGFMVLFRAKIDPRTVISIQSAIPRVIITLVLITFSFAIVGLLIDLMYLFMFVAITALSSAMPNANLATNISNYTGGSLANLWGAVFTPSFQAVDDIVNIIGKGTIDAIGGIVGGLTGAYLKRDSGWMGIAIGGVGGYAAGSSLGVGNMLILLLVWLSLLFTLIRILFTIVNAYIQVMISTIFGPLLLMFDAIPNTNAFAGWIKGLIANLAVFPVVMLLLMLGQILTAYAATENLWRAPGLAGNFQAGVAGIIGLGMMFMIPNIANSIKELLKAKPVIPGGTGAVFSPLSSVWGTGTNLLSQMYYMQMVFSEGGLMGRLFGRGGGGGGGQH